MKPILHYKRSAMVRFLMQVIWPAFLAAIITCGFVFSALDPEHLQLFGKHLPVARDGAYTIGFILIWLQYIAACSSTWWLTTFDAERVARRNELSKDSVAPRATDE